MEQFRNALVTKYYRNADGIVLVFDITKRETFEGLDNWVAEVKQYCEHGMEKLKMVLIGNKVDRNHQRKVCWTNLYWSVTIIRYVEVAWAWLSWQRVINNTQLRH